MSPRKNIKTRRGRLRTPRARTAEPATPPTSRKPPLKSPPGRRAAAGKNGRAAAGKDGGSVPVSSLALDKKSALPLQETPPRGRKVPVPAQGMGRYVYCVIQSPEPLTFGRIGLGAEPAEVYMVNWGDLGVVVSDTPMGVHDPTRENVLAHQRVNETVMCDHTVIPMSFGTVFKTNGDIIELLKGAYDAFKDVLTKMQNKFEFGLKVLWERDQIIREIENEDEDIRRLKSEILNQKGSTYFARMQYGRMIDAALQSRSEYYVAEIFAGLRDVSVASRSNKPIGDKMIMNAAFLVQRNKEKAFDAKIKEIGQRHDKLTFKYTGPWPPYNFVNIRLKLERAH